MKFSIIKNNFSFFNLYLKNIKKIIQYNKDFEKFFYNENVYFNKTKFLLWKKRVYHAQKNIQNFSSYCYLLYLFIFVKKSFLKKSLKYKKQFLYYFKKGEELRREYNENFINTEIKRYTNLLSNVENKTLDKQQREAVVTDEDNNLVIAAAGSGKTLTIVAKIKYLKRKYSLRNSDILLISFTRKSSIDLEKRTGLKAFTFHKLGLNILSEVEKIKPSIFDHQQTKNLLKEFFLEKLKNKKYLNELLEYWILYFNNFENEKDNREYSEDLDKDKLKTYNNIIVKSKEECCIADFFIME